MYIIDSRSIIPAILENKDKQHFFKAQEPDYTQFIPLNLLRRMGKAVRMGIGVSMPLMKVNSPNAIIIGTANGGMEDCIKFLNQIVDYEEGVLTPTNFVQSTPNALAGQLAMMTKNHAYNATHTNNALSFENALLDANLQFHTNEVEDIIVVGLDELSAYNYAIDIQMGIYRENEVFENFIKQPENGSFAGEGAVAFSLAKNPRSNSDFQILSIQIGQHFQVGEINHWIHDFLKVKQLTFDQINFLFLGRNGDLQYEAFYDEVENCFTPDEIHYFKKDIGEYRTVSAVGLNQMFHLSKQQSEKKYFLLYNTFHGRHSLILCQVY